MVETASTMLFERFSVLIGSLLIFFLFSIFARDNGYFSFARPVDNSIPKLPLRELLKVFALFFVLQILVAPLLFQTGYYIYYLNNPDAFRISNVEKQGWMSIYAIAITFIGLCIYFFLKPSEFKQVIVGPYGNKGWLMKLQDFYIATLSWILAYPLVVAIGQLIAIMMTLLYKNIDVEQMAVKQIKIAAESKSLLIALLFCVVFIVPFIEELLFRGYLQNWIKTKMETWKAVGLTSFIFACFHFAPSQGLGNIELIISLFVLSCFLGYLYERQKSLWAPVCLHAIFNSLSIMMIFITAE